MTLSVFDEEWIASARECLDTSWAHDVMSELDTSGGIYLSSLRRWFDSFPVLNKQRRALKKHLESFKNEDHLGAVNELAWWQFMQKTGFKVNPTPTSNTPRPDLQVETPEKFFIEITTLNVSDRDKSKSESGQSVALNHSETIRRILCKMTKEKQRQLAYAADKRQPCVLVLFDYTTWSGYGAQFFRFLAEFLLGKGLGFRELPCELSALVYVEREVSDGRIGISLDRSAIYYNPNATYFLNKGPLTALNQFWSHMVSSEPKSKDSCLWL